MTKRRLKDQNHRGKKNRRQEKAPTPARRWQSDIIVDLIKQFGFPYIALNPGASYRGLHDSLVNYGGNQPPMLLCQHEKIAVQIAHGYAQGDRQGRMIAIVHDVVGMLHATMGIYYAYIAAPIFVIGATGPMTRAGAAPSSTGSTPPTCRASRSAHYVNGTTARQHRGRGRTPFAAPPSRLAEPRADLHVLRRGLQEQAAHQK